MHMFRMFCWINVCLCVTCDFSFCFMAVALLRLFSPFVLGSHSRSVFALSVGVLAEPGVSLCLCLLRACAIMLDFVESDILNLVGDVRCKCVVVSSCAWSCASCARCLGVGAASRP